MSSTESSGVPSFHLPPGRAPGRTVDHRDGPAGSPDDHILLAHFERGGASDLVAALESAAQRLRARPAGEILRTLGRVGGRFLDVEDPLRKEAEERVPLESGLSRSMASEVIAGMARDWTADRLRAVLLADFPDPDVLDQFRPGPHGTRLMAVAGPFAFHISSGNVPGVSATSLIRSLLVKCPLLLKPGRGDIALPVLFARGIAEEDPELAAALAVVYWPGGEGGDLESEALTAAERVVAYGGPELISHLRARIPPHATLVRYAHRISAGAVAREELGSMERSRRAAADAARSVALFDQRGCVSPQVIWVEGGGTISPGEWAQSLAEEMDSIEEELPPGSPDPASAAAAHQIRGTAELMRAAGSGDEVEVLTGEGRTWSVIVEPSTDGSDPAKLPPYSGRTVRVRPIEDLSSLPEVLRPFRSIVQGLALAAPDARKRELAPVIAAAGVTRITSFRDQPWPPPWWRHDGQGPLLALVRWVGLEP